MSFITSQTVTTNGSGQAFYFVTDSQFEEVTFAATDTTQGVGIVPTATFDFNGDNTSTTAGGGPSASQLSEQCAGALTSPAATQPSYGSTYMLIDPNGNAHLVQTVNVTDASGEETATLVVPSGFPLDTNNSQITLDVLDAESPPGIGTPQNPASTSDQYPVSDFSVATSEDPVPGYPNNAPTFQADYSNKFALLSGGRVRFDTDDVVGHGPGELERRAHGHGHLERLSSTTP